MLRRVRDVDPGAQHGDRVASHVERRLMGHRVDAAGQPTDDDVAGAHQPDDERDRRIAAVDRVGAGTDDRDARPLQQLGPPPYMQEGRRLRQTPEGSRVIRVIEAKGVRPVHAWKRGLPPSTQRHPCVALLSVDAESQKARKQK